MPDSMEDFLVPLNTPCVYYDDSFLSKDEAEEDYEYLLKNTKWEKSAKINRWVALHESTANTDYKYRDAPGDSVTGFNDTILKIKQRAEQWYNDKNSNSSNNNNNGENNVEFNVCLLNFYEDGQQRIGWHYDREEIGRNTPIASVSLGAPRSFLLRAKQDGVRDRARIELAPGSIVIMENVCQHQYVHTVPRQDKTEEMVGGRINLTFRCKGEEGHTAGEEEHGRRDTWLEGVVANNVAAPSDFSGGGILSSQLDRPKGSHVFGEGVKTDEVDGGTVVYVVKTNLGAECYCAAEIEEALNGNSSKESKDQSLWDIVARPFCTGGYVSCSRKEQSPDSNNDDNDTRDTVSLLLQLRSAHHVMEYHDHFDLSEILMNEESEKNVSTINGEMLYAFYKKRILDGSATIASLAGEDSGTFRVTTDRIGGPHAFQAPNVEFEVGGAMMEVYTKYKPKMTDYDVNVRVDVMGSKVMVGSQLNVDDLSKGRHFLRFRNVVTLKTNLAYAMVRCANVKPGDLIADPFCGSGTILLEALEVMHNQIRCVGMDVNRRSVQGAKDNALAENCTTDICEFHCKDARAMRQVLEEESVDAIITNLPWGVKTGQKQLVSDLQNMYEVFLRTSWYVLKDGARVVMLVLRGLQMTRILRKLGGRYRILSANIVRTTNNLPCLIVVEKLKNDELHASIKGQLAYMAEYVNVGPEMYKAIHMEKIDETPVCGLRPSVKVDDADFM